MTSSGIATARRMKPTVQLAPPTAAFSSDYANGFIFWSLLAYMTTLVFEGPLRYTLSSIGLGTLIYLRDLLGASCIFVGVFWAVRVRRNIYDPLVVTVYFLVMFALLGLLIQEVTIFSTAFGIKIYAVLIFGIAAAEGVTQHRKTFERAILLFGLASSLGVLINYAVGKLPWEALTYETAFGIVSTTKEWWAEGERRLSGFARASFDAAMVIGLSAGLILPTKNRLYVATIGSLFLASVYLTTSKSMILAVALLIAWLLFTPQRFRHRTGLFICTCFLLLMICLPAISCTFEFNEQLMYQVPHGLSSFIERIVSMWPKSCAILNSPYSWIFGGGIGSIGVPQQYMRLTGGYSSGDNLFVYLYVSGGLVWATAFIYSYVKSIREKSFALFDRDVFTGLTMIIMVYGFTTNMIEQPFFSLVAGLLVSNIWLKHGSK